MYSRIAARLYPRGYSRICTSPCIRIRLHALPRALSRIRTRIYPHLHSRVSLRVSSRALLYLYLRLTYISMSYLHVYLTYSVKVICQNVKGVCHEHNKPRADLRKCCSVWYPNCEVIRMLQAKSYKDTIGINVKRLARDSVELHVTKRGQSRVMITMLDESIWIDALGVKVFVHKDLNGFDAEKVERPVEITPLPNGVIIEYHTSESVVVRRIAGEWSVNYELPDTMLAEVKWRVK